MPTTYATHADVAAQLVGLLPAGFPETPTTGDATPSQADVTAELARVTTGLRIRVVRALGAEPAAEDDAAQLVTRGVVAKVVAWVLRRVATGYSAADAEKLTKPYLDDYRDVLKEIEMLPDLYAAATVQQRHVGTTATANQRDPVLAGDALTDRDLY